MLTPDEIVRALAGLPAPGTAALVAGDLGHDGPPPKMIERAWAESAASSNAAASAPSPWPGLVSGVLLAGVAVAALYWTMIPI